MSLKDTLNESFDDELNPKPNKRCGKGKYNTTQSSKTNDKVLDNLIYKLVGKALSKESSIKKMPKHVDQHEKLCEHLKQYLCEWLKCFILIGYTDDGTGVEITHADTLLDTHALDGILNQLYTFRAASNNLAIQDRIQQSFDADE